MTHICKCWQLLDSLNPELPIKMLIHKSKSFNVYSKTKKKIRLNPHISMATGIYWARMIIHHIKPPHLGRFINYIIWLYNFVSDNETEDWQQPICQRFQRFISTDGIRKVCSLSGWNSFCIMYSKSLRDGFWRAHLNLFFGCPLWTAVVNEF